MASQTILGAIDEHQAMASKAHHTRVAVGSAVSGAACMAFVAVFLGLVWLTLGAVIAFMSTVSPPG